MNERVREAGNFLTMYGFAKSLAEIAMTCGKSRQYFSDLKANRQQASLKFIENLCSNYPQVNKNYILTGEGQPLKTPINMATSQHHATTEKALDVDLPMLQNNELIVQNARLQGKVELLQEQLEKAQETICALRTELEKKTTSHTSLLTPSE